MRLHHALLGLLCLTGPIPVTGFAAPETGSDRLVNCYEPARNLVTRTSPDLCQGRRVSNAEAANIRAQRRDHIKESLTTQFGPGALGKRRIGAGTGFFVDRKGTLLTNVHIVKGCSALTVTRPNEKSKPAKLSALAPSLDLALVTTDLRPKQQARFAPSQQPMPKEIAIVGYPDKGSTPQAPTLTRGTIPSAGSRASAARPLSIKASVQPGNSGGPVLDPAGRVLGVVFATVDTKRAYQETGRVIRDIGMAIPNGIVLNFLRRQGIQPQIDDTDSSTPANNLLQEAKGYLARVECWL